MTVTDRAPEHQAALDALVREVHESRPLPATASRLIAIAADTHFSAQELAATVDLDAALTTKLLHRANSPFSRPSRRITSVHDWIGLLGFREVRSTALATCLIGAAGDAEHRVLDHEQFWCDSLVVAALAQLLAEAEGRDREAAFTAGLVHNVGRLALAQRRPERLALLIEQAAWQRAALHDVQQAELGFSDAELGAAIVRSWNFPEPLCDAVAHHDAPPCSFANPCDLDAIVARARRFAHAHGVTDGVDPPARDAPDPEWQHPRIAKVLHRAGGLVGVMEWARAFLDDSEAA